MVVRGFHGLQTGWSCQARSWASCGTSQSNVLVSLQDDTVAHAKSAWWQLTSLHMGTGAYLLIWGLVLPARHTQESWSGLRLSLSMFKWLFVFWDPGFSWSRWYSTHSKPVEAFPLSCLTCIEKQHLSVLWGKLRGMIKEKSDIVNSLNQQLPVFTDLFWQYWTVSCGKHHI